MKNTTHKFIPANRDQQYFFPEAIQDWLPENHQARFVADIVSLLNLRPFAKTYAGKGFKKNFVAARISWIIKLTGFV